MAGKESCGFCGHHRYAHDIDFGFDDDMVHLVTCIACALHIGTDLVTRLLERP